MNNITNENIDKIQSKDSFILQNKLLFKKYRPIKPIGRGTFSTVYLASNIKTNTYVAIKAEERFQKDVELLETEAFILYSLRGYGIPEVLSYGRTKTHNILVMPLLGRSLLDLLIIRRNPININDICCAAIQILDRIEWVHSNNIVYRDIKPENFLFGLKDKNVLYLIDFGLCRKYKSSKTGKHIQPKNLGKFTGTSRYASVYAMAGNEQSRRDDIESIGYMLIFFMKKKLPWQGIKGTSYKECYHKLYSMKRDMKLEDLCRGLPSEIIDYMNYAKSMRFEEEPDYKYLKNLFKIILAKKQVLFDKYLFSWIRNESITDIRKMNSNTKKERKSSPQNKLYKQIQEKIEIENNNKSIPIINNYDISDKKRNNKIFYDNSVKIKNEINSEKSNTMKVLINKNINTINSGFNESTGVYSKKTNSERKSYNDNIIYFRKNNDLKGNHSQDNIIKHYLPLNKQYSGKKNIDKNIKKKHNNFELKKINIPKNSNANRNRKIISISPIQNNGINKTNNSINSLNSLTLNSNNNYNDNKNKLNKINQIKITKVNNNHNYNINKDNTYLNNINSNNKNSNEKIIYNSYTTYNTYNSYNNTIDKTINNNININNIYHRDQYEIQKYNNFKSIQKNNLDNIINDKCVKIQKFIKPVHFEKNAKSHNNILPKNKIGENIRFNSIDIKPNTINHHCSYRKINNQNYVENQIIKRKNNSLNKYTKNYSKQFLGYNTDLNRIEHNSSNIVNYNSNRIINSIYNMNNNRILNEKNQMHNSNYNLKRKNIIHLGAQTIENNIKKVNENKNYIKIQNIPKSNIKKVTEDKSKYYNNRDNNNIIIEKNKNKYNSYENWLNYNYSNNNIIQNNKKYDYNCNINNFFSFQNDPRNKNILNRRNQSISYISKITNNSNSNIVNNIRHNHKNNSAHRILSLNQNLNFNDQYIIQNGYNDNSNKNKNKLFIKMKAKKLPNHALKIINHSSSNNKNYFIENNYVGNNYMDNNNFYVDKYKTEEVDMQYRGKNNVSNKFSRINKYKVTRNKVTQNN